MNEYLRRDAILRTLGFSDYEDYLKSGLWNELRYSVLRRDHFSCRGCGKKGTEVHHTLYDMATMKGESLKNLVTLCRKCHKNVHRGKSFEDVIFLTQQLLKSEKPERPKHKTRKQKKQESLAKARRERLENYLREKNGIINKS